MLMIPGPLILKPNNDHYSVSVNLLSLLVIQVSGYIQLNTKCCSKLNLYGGEKASQIKLLNLRTSPRL